MIHGKADTSFGIHEHLVRNETELALRIGAPGLTDRQKQVLQLMLDMTRSAIEEKLWIK